MEKYTFEALSAMRILDLRNVGRVAGVEKPTTLDKSSLVNAILDAQSKGEPAVTTVKRRGRPPKYQSEAVNTKGTAVPLTEVKIPEKEEQPVLPNYTETRILETAFIPAVDITVPQIKVKSVKSSIETKAEQPETKKEATEEKRSNFTGNGYAGRRSDGFDKNKHYEKPYNSNYSNNYNNNQNNGHAPFKKPSQSPSYKPTNSFSPKPVEDEENVPIERKEGVLELMPDGYGFLRAKNYESGDGDAYISAAKVKKVGLRKGDYVKAETKKLTENRPAGVVNILEVNGKPYDGVSYLGNRKNFDTLVPIYPDRRIRLEIPGSSSDFAIRAIDLVSPIGKGQRGMIVSPPKAGKTTLLKKIANSISVNYPDVHLIVLLVDERPEEVTDMQRSIHGEVVYSTFDEMPEHHTKAAEMVLDRAKRLVEEGRDVVILMDSLTRLARAYNLVVAPSGRTLSGGIDPSALHSPKRFFGAARNIENGGSLTIIATALVDTGSRMDDVIYEEFKGTGNMEIHLDRRLSEKRIFPAIDLNRSGTRREEMLLDANELEGTWGMRKMLGNGDNADAAEALIAMLVKTRSNVEFIRQLKDQITILSKKGYNV